MVWLWLGVVMVVPGKKNWEITEVMFNPMDENTGEFVEVSYFGEVEADLSGLMIGDAGDVDYLVDFQGEHDRGNEGLKVGPGGVILVVDTDYDGQYNHFFDDYEVDLSNVWMVTVADGRIGNGLGNDGDDLWWGDEEEELAVAEWLEGEEGWSWNWRDGIWLENLSEKYTPGLAGLGLDGFLEEVDEGDDMGEVITDMVIEENFEDEGLDISNQEIEMMLINEIKGAIDGEKVWVKGRVTVPLGVLDKNYLWIQDDSGGIKIKWDDETIEIGEVIEVRGKVNDLTYNRVIQAESVVVVGIEDLVFNAVSGDELAEMEADLVAITGVVAKKNGKSVYVSNGDEQAVRVYIKEDLSWLAEVESGDRLTVRGVVDETSSGFRLLPRFKGDIILIESQEQRLPTVGPDWMRILGFGGGD